MTVATRTLLIALFAFACTQSDSTGGEGGGAAGLGGAGGSSGAAGVGGIASNSGGADAGNGGARMDGAIADGAVGDGSTMDAMTEDAGSKLDAAHDAARDDAAAGNVELPPANGRFDYQLGGGYPPPVGVVTVARDRTEDAAAGVYNICYVNGFQVQPDEDDLWDENLILRDGSGEPVIDEDWDEALLDVGTADKRTRVAALINSFIDGCASKGFDAIEVDNLDSYSRSGGRLSEANAVAFMALLSAHAHSKGLAIAQKNSTELLDRREAMGTDFAVAEECSRYNECGDYIDAYGPHVLMIEYRQQDFNKGCSGFGDTHAIVLRDLDLVTPGDGDYVFDDC